MIRLILALLFVVVFLIVGIILLGALWLYGKLINQRKADIATLRIIQWVFRVVLFISGTKLIVKGKELIPTDRPVLYVGDHRSIFDVIIGYSLCPGPTSFVSKDAFAKVPLFATWMRRLHCLFLDREDPRSGIQMIKQSVEHLEQGISVFIFPEGTRSRTGEMLPFKAGTFKIATKAEAPVVPVAFTNTASILEAQFPRIRKQTVVVHFGGPIYTENMTKEEFKVLPSAAQDFVQRMMDEDAHLV